MKPFLRANELAALTVKWLCHLTDDWGPATTTHPTEPPKSIHNTSVGWCGGWAFAAQSLSRVQVCNLTDHSPPGSSVPSRIFQARILERAGRPWQPLPTPSSATARGTSCWTTCIEWEGRVWRWQKLGAEGTGAWKYQTTLPGLLRNLNAGKEATVGIGHGTTD